MTNGNQDLVHSYLYLRRAIGLIGIALPPVLILGKLWWGTGGLQNSISGYYYSNMRDWLVGGLWAVGVFLLFYGGHRMFDDWIGNLAGLAAIGVALVPTSPSGGPNVSQTDDSTLAVWHVGFSAVFFTCLAVYCLFIFTRNDNETPNAVNKDKRNIVYIVCGIAIVVCMAAILIIGAWFDEETKSWHPVLWLESAAVWAFGIAWLTKGKTIWFING
jgi:hypothetical protein